MQVQNDLFYQLCEKFVEFLLEVLLYTAVCKNTKQSCSTGCSWFFVEVLL